MGYFLKSANGQLKLLYNRIPIEKALKDPEFTEIEKNKMRIALDAREFALKLGLKKNDNFTDYVRLGQPYVTYVVSAAQKWELKQYKWSFPIIGEVPYKGYFEEKDAKEEEESLLDQNLDTYLRGVSAYSTLGWFRDPLLSSMINYSDHDLVDTVIHETVHTTIYIKSSANFNERLAVFAASKGVQKFYLEKEGAESETLKKIKDEHDDEALFSKFITKEMTELEKFYIDLKAIERSDKDTQLNDEIRQKQFELIQTKFTSQVLPNLKSDRYKRFSSVKLNNARLLIYKTYISNMDDFEILYKKSDENIVKFIESCRQLESSKAPEEDLKKLISTVPR